MASLFAQGTTSRVTGTVLDRTGAPVPRASVKLINEGTQATFTTVTGDAGTYVFDSVQVGNYTIEVEVSGFKKFTSRHNPLTIGQPMTVNATLEIGTLTESVEVAGSAEQVQTETSGNIGNLLTGRSIRDLPIVGTRGRNPIDLVLVMPGVVNGANTGGGVHVNGARDRSWNYLVDGIDSNETSAGGGDLSPVRVNPDSLAEFRVITSNPAAEFGRNSGGQGEFDLSKRDATQKAGDITLTLKKADPKRNRYTVEILADDKRLEKRDKSINEPVQLYVSGNRQPYEIVVNEVKKDEVIGYLATPKVKMARR